MALRVLAGRACLVLWCASAGAHPGLHKDLQRADAAVRAAPASADLRLERAGLYRHDGQHKRALAELAAAARRGADPATVERERGRTLAAMGRHRAAVAALTRSIRAAPSWAAYVARGRSRAALGQAARAVADLDTALAERAHVEVALERGRLQLRLGREEEAAAGYRATAGALGQPTLVLDALVDLELARGRGAAALALVDEQLGRRRDARWLLRRAEALAVTGDAEGRAGALAEALAIADRAVRGRASAVNLVTRARVHLALGAEARAREDARRAVARAPGYAAARALRDELETGR